VNGFLTGWGLLQNNHIPGDDTARADLSNGQIVIRKTDGVFQFYLQTEPIALRTGCAGSSRLKISSAHLWRYPSLCKGAAGKNTSFMIVRCPPYRRRVHLSFENMNVERGLLGIRRLISRGINESGHGQIQRLVFSWNDGFYSIATLASVL